MKPLIKQWVVGIAGVVGFFLGLMWFCDAFRAYTVPFAVVWLVAPRSLQLEYSQLAHLDAEFIAIFQRTLATAEEFFQFNRA